MNTAGLTGRARSRRVSPGLESVARRVALWAAARAQGAAFEVVEDGRIYRLGSGDLVARVEVHDPRGLSDGTWLWVRRPWGQLCRRLVGLRRPDSFLACFVLESEAPLD